MEGDEDSLACSYFEYGLRNDLQLNKQKNLEFSNKSLIESSVNLDSKFSPKISQRTLQLQCFSNF